MISLKVICAALRDFVYPPVCRTCDRLLQDGSEAVCRDCWESFRRVASSDAVWIEISEIIHADDAVDDFLSCYLFEKEGALQEVIHLLKYSGAKSIGRRLGEDLGDIIAMHPRFCGADYLVPVPLHRRKLRERGYNQSEIICSGTTGRIHVPVLPSLLVRTRHTGSQTRLNRHDRKVNVEGAFGINPRCPVTVRGKTIILVDDVITTASTMKSCASVLRSSGAARILATSIALAP